MGQKSIKTLIILTRFVTRHQHAVMPASETILISSKSIFTFFKMKEKKYDKIN